MTPQQLAAKGNLPAILRNTIADWMRDEVEDMLPAQVISYDRASNRAVVRPLVMLGVGNNKVQRPAQVNTPVFRFGGGGFFISMPLKPGDLGWIKANDRDISLVMQRQGQEDWPNTTRTHDFNDAMFFPDMIFGGTISDDDQDAMVIQSEDGSVCIALHDGRLVLTAPVVEVNAMTLEFNTMTTEINGSLIFNGQPYIGHRHTDVEPGVGISGPVSP
jgi:hypothetical protein